MAADSGGRSPPTPPTHARRGGVDEYDRGRVVAAPGDHDGPSDGPGKHCRFRARGKKPAAPTVTLRAAASAEDSAVGRDISFVSPSVIPAVWPGHYTDGAPHAQYSAQRHIRAARESEDTLRRVYICRAYLRGCRVCVHARDVGVSKQHDAVQPMLSVLQPAASR